MPRIKEVPIPLSARSLVEIVNSAQECYGVGGKLCRGAKIRRLREWADSVGVSEGTLRVFEKYLRDLPDGEQSPEFHGETTPSIGIIAPAFINAGCYAVKDACARLGLSA